MRFLLAIILLHTFLYAATLHGEIISAEDFENLNNTIIKIQGPINTQFVANENYSIGLPPGNYKLYAYYYEKGALKYYSSDEVLFGNDDIRFDIVLLPSEFQDVYDLEVEDLPIVDEQKPADIIPVLLVIIIILIIIVILYVFYQQGRKKQEAPKAEEEQGDEEEAELDEDAEKILKILKEQEGRMMQRELREILNFSETKMSLIMAELEALELIKRIKRGRENIVKLKEKKEGK